MPDYIYGFSASVTGAGEVIGSETSKTFTAATPAAADTLALADVAADLGSPLAEGASSGTGTVTRPDASILITVTRTA